MPIYEYQCEGCAHRFEIKQGFNDPPLSICERCGGAVRKLISAPAIMFKGSGWYVTDYSDKLKPPTTGSDQAPKDGKPPADGKRSKDGDGKADQAAKKEAPAAAGSATGTGNAAPSKSSSSEGSSSGSSSSPSGTSSSGSSSSSSST